MHVYYVLATCLILVFIYATIKLAFLERNFGMSITAKELANKLGLSPATISIVFNNRQGVSEETRQRVLAAAKEHGYKFSVTPEKKQKTISFVLFKKTGGAVVDDTPFFSAMTEGIATCCREHDFSLDIRYIFEDKNINSELNSLVTSGSEGIILLATEMKASDFETFKDLNLPMVVLDTYFESISIDYVLINNIQGAFLATDTLFKTRRKQPGYLHSSYSIGNFEERADGFYKAIRQNGMSPSASIVHMLTPSIEGAYTDMKQLLSQGIEIADCYFADNDMIAIGAMRAFKKYGYRIPKDVAFIGFDNAYPNGIISPPLTTIDVPKQAMGRLAVERLIYIMSDDTAVPVKTELLTSLIYRSTL